VQVARRSGRLISLYGNPLLENGMSVETVALLIGEREK